MPAANPWFPVCSSELETHAASSLIFHWLLLPPYSLDIYGYLISLNVCRGFYADSHWLVHTQVLVMYMSTFPSPLVRQLAPKRAIGGVLNCMVKAAIGALFPVGGHWLSITPCGPLLPGVQKQHVVPSQVPPNPMVSQKDSPL